MSSGSAADVDVFSLTVSVRPTFEEKLAVRLKVAESSIIRNCSIFKRSKYKHHPGDLEKAIGGCRIRLVLHAVRTDLQSISMGRGRIRSALSLNGLKA